MAFLFWELLQTKTGGRYVLINFKRSFYLFMISSEISTPWAVFFNNFYTTPRLTLSQRFIC